MAKIIVNTVVEIEPREDHWAAYVPAFGFTVYAETKNAVREEAYSALDVLIDSFKQDMDAIARFLEERNVHYNVVDVLEGSPQPASAEVLHAEVVVAR